MTGALKFWNGTDWALVGGVGPPGPGVPLVTPSEMSQYQEDGQTVDVLVTNWVVWRFRYSEAVADAYKWLFVGGSPLEAVTNATVQMPTTAQAPIPAVVTVPRAGRYRAETIVLCRPYVTTTAVLRTYSNVALNGQQPASPGAIYTQGATTFPSGAASTYEMTQTTFGNIGNALGAGDTVQPIVWSTTGGFINAIRGAIHVTPVRVS